MKDVTPALVSAPGLGPGLYRPVLKLLQYANSTLNFQAPLTSSPTQ